MTIAERIHNDGWLLGMGKEGKKKENGASSRLLLQNGADPEWIQRYTGLSAEQMQIGAALPESKREPWIGRINQETDDKRKALDALRYRSLHNPLNILNLKGFVGR